MPLKKLYPPQIEGTIPAFCGDKIIVPYSMNKTVSPKEVGGFALKIKTVTSNQYIAYVESNGFTADQAEFDIGDFKDKLNIGQHYKVQLAYINKEGEKQKLVGYYSTIGVVKYTAEPQVYIEGLTSNINQHIYDYIGVYKIPSYQINGQTVYDTNEKVYSHHFTIEDKEHNVIYQTEELIHQGINDDETDLYTQHDPFSYTREFEEGMSYYIQYTVTTMNDMVVSSPKYRLMEQITAPMLTKPQVIATLDYENGYITISFKNPKKENGGENINVTMPGAYRLLRSDESSNYTIWDEIAQIKIPNYAISKISPIYDFTIMQGVRYKYALQQFSDNGMVSEKVYSNEILGDFEDLFLYDGEKQLKVKYNPKVTSFKNTRMEAKVDTIGSKYPFIFRNGNVQYKEMPISGLISYLSDEEELFIQNIVDKENHRLKTMAINPPQFLPVTKENEIPNKEIQAEYDERVRKHFGKQRTTQLTSENIAIERKFKLAVMDWLENGKPKLLRSPGEGNYIVRLLNNSLSPNDTLGRMLHTFSCTAYEIADYTYENLLEYGFAQVDDINSTTPCKDTINLDEIRFIQQKLKKYEINENISTEMYNLILTYYPDARACFYPAYGTDKGYILQVSNEELKQITIKDGNILRYSPALNLVFSNMLPGDVVYLDDGIAHGVKDKPTGFEVTIGQTGEYISDESGEINKDSINPETALKIYKVSFEGEHETSDRFHSGTLTYWYEVTQPNSFEHINNVSIQDILSRSFIGPQDNLINILKESKKYNISQIYLLKYKSRPLYGRRLYAFDKNREGQSGIIYTDQYCTERFTDFLGSPETVYKVYITRNNIDNMHREIDPDEKPLYYEYKNGELTLLENYETGILLEYSDQGYTTPVDSSDEWQPLNNLSNISSIKVNNGAMVELSYQLKITDYSVEETTNAKDYPDMVNTRDVYNNKLAIYQKMQEQLETKVTWTNEDITNLKIARVAYLSAKANYLRVCDKYIGEEDKI